MFDDPKYAAQAEIVKNVREYIDAQYGDCTVDNIALQDLGFAAVYRDSLILVYADLVEPGEAWFLHLVGGIAIGVGDNIAALQWVNTRNRDSSTLKYYCSLDGSPAVLFEVLVPHTLLDFPNEPCMDWVIAVVNTVMVTAPEEQRVFLSEHAGESFLNGAVNSTVLFMMSSG